MDDLDRYIRKRCKTDPEFKRLMTETQAAHDEIVRTHKKTIAQRIIGAFSFPKWASPNDSLAKEREM